MMTKTLMEMLPPPISEVSSYFTNLSLLSTFLPSDSKLA